MSHRNSGRTTHWRSSRISGKEKHKTLSSAPYSQSQPRADAKQQREPQAHSVQKYGRDKRRESKREGERERARVCVCADRREEGVGWCVSIFFFFFVFFVSVPSLRSSVSFRSGIYFVCVCFSHLCRMSAIVLRKPWQRVRFSWFAHTHTHR